MIKEYLIIKIKIMFANKIQQKEKQRKDNLFYLKRISVNKLELHRLNMDLIMMTVMG